MAYFSFSLLFYYFFFVIRNESINILRKGSVYTFKIECNISLSARCCHHIPFDSQELSEAISLSYCVTNTTVQHKPVMSPLFTYTTAMNYWSFLRPLPPSVWPYTLRPAPTLLHSKFLENVIKKLHTQPRSMYNVQNLRLPTCSAMAFSSMSTTHFRLSVKHR